MMKKRNYLFIILDGILGKKKTNFSFVICNKILFISHDEWIKLDRVIERKDSTNANTLFQQRPRRTSLNTLRQQHLDSTNSIEQNNPQQITNSSITDVNSTPSLSDYDEQNKILKTISIERNKIEESDIDDNSQGQSESN